MCILLQWTSKNLPEELRPIKNLPTFKLKLKTFLLPQAYEVLLAVSVLMSIASFTIA